MNHAHTLDPTILRKYDIRGIVGETLDPEDLTAIGRAYGTLLKRADGLNVAVAYDGRLSSSSLEEALVEGLLSVGLKVYRLGMGPSPMAYYATHAIPTDGCCMITGSHNPPEYNGVKMTFLGKPFFGPNIRKLGKISATGDFETGAGETVRHPILDDFVDRVAGDHIPGKRLLKVAWDPGNGVAGEALQKLVAKLPGEHFLINETVDGSFPGHHPDPTVEGNLTQLKELVAKKGCDLGIAFDGDGDRIGVVDGEGRVIWGDQLLTILAAEILAEQPGATIIADVKASRTFFDEVERMGGKAVMWKTGHSLIKNKMAETGAPLAGEMSAHIFYKHRYYGYDDALYAAVRLLSILAGSDQSLADMRDAMPTMVNTPELRFACPEERKFQAVEEVKERLKGLEGVTVHDMDGVRVQSEDGWWLLRASNTQAVLVARCESDTREGLGRLGATLARHLEAVGLGLPTEY